MQDVIGRGACTRVASARARQRASAQRVRFAAPVQRAQLFQHGLEQYDLQLRAWCMFIEMFGLLLPPPRAWRALARAETRARAAVASHARSAVRECVRAAVLTVLLYVGTRAPSRAWHAVCSVTARYAAWHANPVFLNTKLGGFRHQPGGFRHHLT